MSATIVIAVPFGVLIIVSIIALIRVFTGTAGAQAITPSPVLMAVEPGLLVDRRRDHPVHLHPWGLSSTQTTILPTARGTLSMAVYEALPKRFAGVHPKYMTPAFGTIVMGCAALFVHLVLTFLSENALLDSVASLGLAVAFYSGVTAFACVWYFRRTLFDSARNLFFRGIFPLLGGIAMAAAFGKSAIDMMAPDYGNIAFGPIGGVFVLGVGV